ncbi:MAG: hypothetical protein ABH851_01290, partial [Methanobacteriota archaeon]
MVSDPEFKAKAEKILQLNEKLTNLLNQGKISREVYEEKKKLFFEKLSILKEINIGLYDKEIEALNSNKSNLEQQLQKNIISQEQCQSMLGSHKKQEDELTSERGLIELYDDEEYLEHLCRQNERPSSGLESSSDSPGTRIFSPPSSGVGVQNRADIPSNRPYAIIIVLFLFSVVMGIISSSLGVVVGTFISIFVVLVIASLILHGCTIALKVEGASPGRAFTTTATIVVVSIVFSFILMILGPLGVIFLFGIEVAVVRYFYGLGWVKAGVTVILFIGAIFIANLILTSVLFIPYSLSR